MKGNGKSNHFRQLAKRDDKRARDMKRQRDTQLTKAKLAFGPGGFAKPSPAQHGKR